MFMFAATQILHGQDRKSGSRVILDLLRGQVLLDLKTDSLHPTVPSPYGPGWVVRVAGVNAKTESDIRGEILEAVGGRVATKADARVEKLEILTPLIRGDSALVYVDRGIVWCGRGQLSTVGMVHEYRFVRSGKAWRFLRRDRGMVYDPPPPATTVTESTCIPAYAR